MVQHENGSSTPPWRPPCSSVVPAPSAFAGPVRAEKQRRRVHTVVALLTGAYENPPESGMAAGAPLWPLWFRYPEELQG
jgi:hypothetical protein